jgi:hypothetical protein
MTPEQARAIIRAATWDDDGTFTVLRLGQDPGKDRVHELRLALRVLWRSWKAEAALPFDIAQAAAVILHMRSEAEQNLRASTRELRPGVVDELADIAYGAYELLLGSDAEMDAVPRPDLGEYKHNQTMRRTGPAV